MDAEPRIVLPDAPALAVGLAHAAWLTPDGEIEDVPVKAAAKRIKAGVLPILCHLPATAQRLGRDPFPAHDVLELFAFVRPTGFCVPTPRGVAEAMAVAPGDDLAGAALALVEVAERLLAELAAMERPRGITGIARAMARGGWPWAGPVLAALGEDAAEARQRSPGAGLDVWRRLPQWSEHAPPQPPGSEKVTSDEARERLVQLLGSEAEPRPSQADYASAIAAAFEPREEEGEPRFILAEAGTGVGKTLGYIAPASLWAEKNEAPVWLSTYTRNLQHQIDQELDRLYPDPATKARRVVVRKGRENYLCLLNMEDAVKGVAVRREDAVGLGLLARWAGATRDGDMTGGDFPSWLVDLLGRRQTLELTDHHGECIYSACTHYDRCFIERGVRRARRADLVIANHALVMIQAARGLVDRNARPTRYVFDEGHHVFDAADSAFSAVLSGRETAELRRWLRGAEGRRRARARGLKTRIDDLIAGDEDAEKALEEILRFASTLPGEGWHQRCAEGQPKGAAESFFATLRAQVYARAPDADTPYDIESEITDPSPELLAAATALDEALARIEVPIRRLRGRLMARLDAEADELDTPTRNRIESISQSLGHRGQDTLAAWRDMLGSLGRETPSEFVDWFSVERAFGRDADIGMHRHWIDPTQPFAEVVAAQAHGLVITSATLRDGTGDMEADWASAEARTGANHLPQGAVRAAVPSPFAYDELTRVLVVTDVGRGDLDQLAAAYRELFKAAGGGALGLFTAISRLRAVHERIAEALDEAGLALYAQHVDRLNLATLIDIFRVEEHACLLGTDAVRDGVDVPGPSLRLIVFDRVPWPRPSILHRTRRNAFGKAAYDDMITRLRLKQAYGRLVRRAGDRGLFVMLDARMPSRLAGAFPDGVGIERVGLADAIATVREFFPSS